MAIATIDSVTYDNVLIEQSVELKDQFNTPEKWKLIGLNTEYPILYQKHENNSFILKIVVSPSVNFNSLLGRKISCQLTIDRYDYDITAYINEPPEKTDRTDSLLKTWKIVLRADESSAIVVTDFCKHGIIEPPYVSLALEGTKGVYSFVIAATDLTFAYGKTRVDFAYNSKLVSLLDKDGYSIKFRKFDGNETFFGTAYVSETMPLLLFDGDIRSSLTAGEYQLTWTIANAIDTTFTTNLLPKLALNQLITEPLVIDGVQYPAKSILLDIYELKMFLSRADFNLLREYWQVSNTVTMTLPTGEVTTTIARPQIEVAEEQPAFDCVPCTVKIVFNKKMYSK